MQEAADENIGGMVAIIGIEDSKIRTICSNVKEIGYTEIANINAPGQVIISGEKRALEKVGELAWKERAKLVIPLEVSGPWHSKLMRGARAQIEEMLKSVNFGKPTIPVISNVTADYELEPDLIRKNLVKQITSPVLWAPSIEKFISDRYHLFVEVGPKRVLSGLMRYINREVKVFNIEDMETLQRFLKSESFAR